MGVPSNQVIYKTCVLCDHVMQFNKNIINMSKFFNAVSIRNQQYPFKLNSYIDL